MIFSSPEFILIFLPISFFGYFLLNHYRMVPAAKIWLVAMSFFFYGYWNIAYLPLLIGSILFNFGVGTVLATDPSMAHKGISTLQPKLSRTTLLTFGIAANLGLLGYYKYANFFLDNLSTAFALNVQLQNIILPLGVSFFTFTQIAYLVDSYQGKVKEYNLTNYMLFVTFFPHLIAGPILHHKEMMSQFESKWTLAIRYRHLFAGFFIFSIGFFKKVVIADTFAVWANLGFDSNSNLDFFSAWATSLSYTFQLYFDFSGYCDMAIGSALLFNIWLPLNFNSPYKALDIQDFWHRWHMTLSRYLKDYLYIPLGGNRRSTGRVYVNLFVTFVLGGLWHGASWMFVIWGSLHGFALIIHRIWRKMGGRLPNWLAWLVTFLFINTTWIFFRAESMTDALRVLTGMLDLHSILHFPVNIIPTERLAWGGILIDKLTFLLPSGIAANLPSYVAITIAFIIISQMNSQEFMRMPSRRTAKLIACSLLFSAAFYVMMISTSTVFLYFNF
ncbi:membrane-bound O-acyltransferase family protein [Thiocystis minor]|uniref:MBOAT family O-acyltransferase n=1 Tax=Thiocystis minor TaxID=61597 RepID=UPI0019140475|nr:MBOAT family O-acyltransferase [Thiocystis minor]MBK5966113.1 membrane-bound O-acyltransferase family protein [Thiocystis minor]